MEYSIENSNFKFRRRANYTLNLHIWNPILQFWSMREQKNSANLPHQTFPLNYLISSFISPSRTSFSLWHLYPNTTASSSIAAECTRATSRQTIAHLCCRLRPLLEPPLGCAKKSETENRTEKLINWINFSKKSVR